MALSSSVDTRFDAKLTARVRELTSLAVQAQKYALSATVNIARAAAKKAGELTPRSQGAGPHMADAWGIQQIISGDEITVRVYNADPRATEKLVLADGTQTPYTLLDILEYGSDPHVILPANNPPGLLIFFWPKIGAMVRSKIIDHPGTRPYAMIALARTQANKDMKLAFDALRTVLRFAMAGKTSRLAEANPFGGG